METNIAILNGNGIHYLPTIPGRGSIWKAITWRPSIILVISGLAEQLSNNRPKPRRRMDCGFKGLAGQGLPAGQAR